MVRSQSSTVSSSIGRAMSTPGVVDQDADLAERGRHVLHDARRLDLVGHIGGDPVGLDACRAELLNQRADLVGSAGADPDAIAGAAEGEGGGSADAMGGAGDQRGGRGGHGKKIISFQV